MYRNKSLDIEYGSTHERLSFSKLFSLESLKKILDKGVERGEVSGYDPIITLDKIRLGETQFIEVGSEDGNWDIASLIPHKKNYVEIDFAGTVSEESAKEVAEETVYKELNKKMIT